VKGERRVQLSRRQLPTGPWQSIVFDDHTQVEDDGHNVICFGICHQDGSIHISWDLHSSVFNYRRSLVDLVSDPGSALWSTDSFGPVEHALPGLHQDMSEVSSACPPSADSQDYVPSLPVFAERSKRSSAARSTDRNIGTGRRVAICIQ
jgi:hypothetical protein